MRQREEQVCQVAANGLGRRDPELAFGGRIEFLDFARRVEHEHRVEGGGKHGLPGGGLAVELLALLRDAAGAEQHFVRQPLEFPIDLAAWCLLGEAAIDACREVREAP